MEKKRIIFVSVLFFLIIFLNVLVFFNSGFSYSIQGKSSDSGLISLRIVPNCFVNITSPLNGSHYSFNYSDVWGVDLNVTSNCDLSFWNYSVYSYSLGNYVYSNIYFVPNSTAILYSGLIDLVVRAQNDLGDVFSSNSTIFVNVSNSAPVLNFTLDELFVCENNSLIYEFDAYDLDNETLYFDLYPTNPFFVLKKSQQGIYAFAELLSLRFDKIYIDSIKRYSTYELLISVYEARAFGSLSDSKYVNVTVFEINNAPVIENIGSKTVWLRGENSSLNFNVNAFDREDGMGSFGNLKFNISFAESENLFEISNTGAISYSPINGHQGIYSVRVCVEDNGFFIDNPNYSTCLEQGYTNNSLSACDNFFLTVTDVNRPPKILSSYPLTSLSGNSYTNFYFNVSSYDPDLTLLDIYWYVNGEQKKFSEALSNDSFSYSFGCGVSGVYNVSVVVSDGSLNASTSWEVVVDLVNCPIVPQFSSVSGGAVFFCEEKWACNSWEPCKSLDDFFSNDFSNLFTLELVREQCMENSFFNNFCGFQVRECFDLNSCMNKKFVVEPPQIFRSCYYTLNPNCEDGILNCHSGGCEVGIDCGGPCAPCPSCSDGIQNQGEQGVDCGGPCPTPCLDPLEKATNYYLILIFILIAFLIIILFSLIIYKLYIIFFLHKEDDEKKRK